VLDLGKMDKGGNCLPFHNGYNAENYPKSDEQSETRRPAMRLICIDIVHDYFPRLQRANGGLRVPAASAIRTNIGNGSDVVPTDGTRLPIDEAETSACRRFLGSSQPSKALGHAWTLHCFAGNA
jgi:hypothetical protein